MAANWALAMGQFCGGILHSFADWFMIRWSSSVVASSLRKIPRHLLRSKANYLVFKQIRNILQLGLYPLGRPCKAENQRQIVISLWNWHRDRPEFTFATGSIGKAIDPNSSEPSQQLVMSNPGYSCTVCQSTYFRVGQSRKMGRADRRAEHGYAQSPFRPVIAVFGEFAICHVDNLHEQVIGGGQRDNLLGGLMNFGDYIPETIVAAEAVDHPATEPG